MCRGTIGGEGVLVSLGVRGRGMTYEIGSVVSQFFHIGFASAFCGAA